MPEGPEIRKAADQVARAVQHHPAGEVFFSFSRLKSYQAKLRGQRIKEVETRGKAMLVHFENDLSIYSHNQLYGLWMVRPAYSYPDTRRQLRLAIHNAKKSALLYSASDIEVLTPKQILSHPFLSRLGPDVLNATSGDVLKQVTSQQHKRRRLAALFLDQRFVAGVGNYLRSEILFVAGLHPHLRPVDCTPEQLRSLAKATLAIPRRSYRHGGITNDVKLARRLKAQGQERNDYRHWVFHRDNKPCRICGKTILKDLSGGRGVYFCPQCQGTEQ